MLTTLRLRNLALVDELTIELPPGLVVITGETGAGKSIIIGALNLVLGERADRGLIRGGGESCTVEAAFAVEGVTPDLAALLEQNGIEPCEAHQLLLKRVFTASGSNRQFINGTPTTLKVLSVVGDLLVDMHGPHDHQSLLHPGRQLGLLDAYGALDERTQAFRATNRARGALEQEIKGLVMDDRAYAQQLDLLRFQVHEIGSAALEPQEVGRVEAAYEKASNASRLLQLGRTALNALNDDEHSVANQAGVVGRLLRELERIDAETEPLVALHARMVGAARDLGAELSSYLDGMDLDPGQLGALEERLNLIHALRRKYGSTVQEILEFGERARRKLEQLESRDAELTRLKEALDRVDAELRKQGSGLTRERRKAIPQLVEAVETQLASLGFLKSQFDIDLTSTTTPGSNGFDAVEFLFAPNPGEPPRPLRAIASSGEMARVMLAVKTVLATQDEVPVLIFDEVDANVGGETAVAVGERMRRIAERRQVLCITHLAQVAAAGSAHFVVTKEAKEGRTVSRMRELPAEERVDELARMLGGRNAAARRHATAMLEQATNPNR